MLYRQIRFPVTKVSPDFVSGALREAELLEEAFHDMSEHPLKEIAWGENDEKTAQSLSCASTCDCPSGAGHVAIGRAQRGLVFAFFTLLFMLLTYATTTPDQSFIGRHAGGLFIWALSLTDVYRLARIDHIAKARAEQIIDH
jgi:hypothetical protein